MLKNDGGGACVSPVLPKCRTMRVGKHVQVSPRCGQNHETLNILKFEILKSSNFESLKL